MERIRVENVSKSFGATRVVNSLNLDVPAGSLFFLLGSSGCGKTTMLRMIAGFVQPSSGRIHLGDRDITDLAPEKRECGMVFQSYALWPHLTVEDNVGFGLDVRRVRGAERTRRVREALEMVRMDAFADRKPNQLSGGQQQRVALARAVVIRPKVLLLDEPLSNLDAKLRVEMRGEIRRICKEAGTTTVYVTHDQDEALSIADSIVVMRNGAVEQQGSPRELYERPSSRFIADFLGETNFLSGTVTALDAGGATVATPAGNLRCAMTKAADGVAALQLGGTALLSVRCESMEIVAGDPLSAGQQVIRGKCAGTTYLGKSAQHIVEVGEARLRVLEHNPRHASLSGEAVQLLLDPAQIVVVSAGASGT